jgi:hypothetical protein
LQLLRGENLSICHNSNTLMMLSNITGITASLLEPLLNFSWQYFHSSTTLINQHVT